MEKLTDILPQGVFLANQVRQREPELARQAGLPMYLLMEMAGEAVWQRIQNAYPRSRLLVLCGKGNNGGDGFVVARLARQAGWNVTLIQLEEGSQGDAEKARQAYLIRGGEISPWSAHLLDKAELIVDAMLGTGFKGQLRSPYREIIHKVNHSDTKVISLDIPSGLCADTGQPMPQAIIANDTVTFVAPKPGLLTGSGPRHVNRLSFAGLGIGESMQRENSSFRLTEPLHWPARAADAHKGQFGHVLIIGGGPGMGGAVRLAAEAALRSGAGLVSVICHPNNRLLVASGRPELMVHGLEEVDEAAITLARRASVIAIGPGLGTSTWGLSFWQMVLKCQRPLVVDADALNLLAQNKVKIKDWVLTPHPGEAARLLELTSTQVNQDRESAVRRLQREFGGTVLLKGAGSLVCAGKTCFINPTGNPGMATAGMGDLLTGIIVALRAQGISALEASCFAANMHGKAADLVAQQEGQRGLIASDLLPHIRNLVNYE